MIQTIHRFWGGPEPIPDNYREFGEQWEALNPGWKHILWTEETILQDGIINKDVWDDLAIPAQGFGLDEIALATQRADVIGYEIVYKHGGLYVNTDIQPVRPIQHLINEYPQIQESAAAPMEDEDWVVNAALWAPQPHMMFWQYCVQYLPERYYSYPKTAFMNERTGPHLLTHAWRVLPPGLLVTLDKNTFNPIHWSQVMYGQDAEFNKDDLPHNTIAVHHWGHRKNQRAQTPSV